MEAPNSQQAVKAAFDSVNLINKLIQETANESNKKTVERNVQHLELMLTKDFFLEALTPQQKTSIEQSISSGKSFME
jgi:hypothetical protein